MTQDASDMVPVGYAPGLFDLDGRVVVITGAGSGLGEAFARGLAQVGVKVALLDINDKGLSSVADSIRGGGGTCETYRTDVTDREDLDRTCQGVLRDFGTVDVLINSAGTAFRSPAESFPEDRFDFIIGLNLKGTFLACQVFGSVMLQSGRGSIINVSSIGAEAAYPLASAYQASKGGVKQLTKALALEWLDRGVRVNGIGPTLMDSPLTSSVAESTTVTEEFIRHRMIRNRLGLPRELIGTAIFLASDASSLVTGHTIMCDDGYTIA